MNSRGHKAPKFFFPEPSFREAPGLEEASVARGPVRCSPPLLITAAEHARQATPCRPLHNGGALKSLISYQRVPLIPKEGWKKKHVSE